MSFHLLPNAIFHPHHVLILLYLLNTAELLLKLLRQNLRRGVILRVGKKIINLFCKQSCGDEIFIAAPEVISLKLITFKRLGFKTGTAQRFRVCVVVPNEA